MPDWIVKYWGQWLFGLVAAALAAAYRRLAKKVKARTTEEDAIKNGMLAILHDRLYSLCTWHLSTESVGVEDLRNLEYLYNAYHALGGNGTGTELYNRVKKLEIKKEDP